MSTPARPMIMLIHEMLAQRREVLEAQGYSVVGPEPLSDADRAEVQAIVYLGDQVLTPDYLKSFPKLSLIACVAAGYDGVDVAWCAAHGIAVTHAEAINANDVADVAIGLMISAWRDLSAGERMIREGRWTKALDVKARPGLGGRKMGIVGLGAIGAAAARRAEAFGLQVAWWGPRDKPGAPWPRAESLLALATDSDILVVASRAEASNRGMISREVIEALGPRGLLVNVGRGSLVDEDALIEALKDGRLGRAGLDVFAVEPTPAARWADVPNVVVAPHMGGNTVDSIPAMVAQVWENLRRHFAGEPLLSPVTA